MVRDAFEIVKRLFGLTPAKDFGPKRLKGCRKRMVKKDWSRGYINSQVARIRRAFRWAVEEEMIPGEVYHRLAAVQGIRKGRGGVREGKKVKAVAEAVVRATMPFMPRLVRAMVELEMLTGMRPGEVCIIRSGDIEMAGRVWIYHPQAHKTEGYDKDREVYIGPKAQEVLKPWLKLDLQAYLFSHREAEVARNAERKEKRETPLTPSQRRRKPKERPKRAKRECYDETSFRNAVYRACDRLHPPSPPLGQEKGESVRKWKKRLTKEQKAELTRWRNDHRWHPNQLRHTAATLIRKDHGIELARIILGHSKAFTTEIYAEADKVKAQEIIAKIG
jgi:integrase